MGRMIPASLAVAGGLMALPLVATPVLAQQAAQVNFYGQFSPSYQFVDDGQETYDELTDNAGSNTRIGMTVTTALGPGELKFTLESAIGLRSSSSISQTNKPEDIDWRRTSIRKLDFEWSSPYGTFSLGQGSTASDGAAEVDFSGTNVASYAGIADSAGGYQFRTAAGALSGISLGAASGDFDGARRTRFRYDTPDFGGFVFSTSYGQEILQDGNDNDYYDVAVRYSKDIGDYKVAAATAYAWVDRPVAADTETVVVSGALLHKPTGLNLAVSAGNQTEGGDASFGYVKLGYTHKFFAVGETRVSIDYYKGQDYVTLGDDTKSTALTFVQAFDKANLEVFASLRNTSYQDASVTSYQDLDSVFVGARLKF